MLYLRTIFLLAFFCFVLVSCFAKDLTVASDANSGPGWSKGAHENGYIIHIVKEALALADIELEMVWMPWKRAFEDTKNNKLDATCCWFYVDQRTKDFYYSDPVVYETQYFFHLRTFDFDWDSVSDLKDLRIGADTGFHYGDDFQSAEEKAEIKVERVSTYAQNLKKLLAGRIDIYPAALLTANEHMRKNLSVDQIEKLTYHDKPVLSKPLHLLIPKKMPKKRALEILTAFNKGLKDLKAKALYQQIIKDAENGRYSKVQEESRLAININCVADKNDCKGK